MRDRSPPMHIPNCDKLLTGGSDDKPYLISHEDILVSDLNNLLGLHSALFSYVAMPERKKYSLFIQSRVTTISSAQLVTSGTYGD